MVPAVAILAAAAATGTALEPTDIALGEVRHGQMRADEVHDYRVKLNSGQSYLLELEQGGLDLVVTILAPTGGQVGYTAPFLRLESERILLEPTQGGVHLIRLESNEFTGTQARYRLALALLTQNYLQSTLHRDALRNESLGAKAYFQGGEDAWPKVSAEYLEALETWLNLDDRPAAARASLALAHVLYNEMTDWPGAINEAARAAELYRAIGNRSLYASAIHLKAAALLEEATQLSASSSLADTESDATALITEARQLLDQASSIKAELGEEFERARITNDIAASFYYQGAFDEASTYLKSASSMFRAADEWSEELRATNNLGVIQMDQGHLAEALVSFSRVLELATSDTLPGLHGETLDNLSIAHRALGDIDSALAASLEALRMHEMRGELKAKGRSLGSIGMAYFQVGDLERAREHLEAALEVRRRANDGRGQAAALRYLGNIYREQRDFSRAIAAHREAAALGGSVGFRTQAQVLLGADLAAAGQLEEALEVLGNAAVEAEREGSPSVVAQTLLERGAVFRRVGRTADAENDLERAHAKFRDAGMLRHQARAAFELAQLNRESARFDDAVTRVRQAIELTERQRVLITSPDFRAAFLGSRHEYYHFYVDLLISSYFQSEERHLLHTALEVSEQYRARALTEMLAEAEVQIGAGLDPAMREREAELHNELAGLRYRHEALVGGRGTQEQLTDVLQKLRRVEAELDGLDSAIRRENPAYAGLRSPIPLSLSGIRAELDSESMLIHYVLSDPRAYVFLMTDTSLEVVALSSGSEISSLALLAHENLKTLDPGQRAGNASSPLHDLAARVLWPIEGFLVKPRLVIVPDGALHYVPFAALPMQESRNKTGPLLLAHEVVSVPSMSVLAAQRQLQAGRDAPRLGVAVIADPVFESNDPRILRRHGAFAQADDRPAPTQMRDRRPDALRRLPGTGTEARVIASLVAESMRTLITGLAANRDAFLSLPLHDYRIVHLATHGSIDTRYPALSALALSSYDADGHEVDGHVRLRDIYSIKLNADLVVLSACNTALGRELRGEGIIGLTRGFQFAGSRSVIASLWQVPDRATPKLIEILYSALLQRQVPAPNALREAQLAIAKTRRWRDPYYWAAPVAYGEWR